MRILQVNNFHYPRGGADRYFLDLTSLLRERGHVVQTFSTARPENVNDDWLAVRSLTGVRTEGAAAMRDAARFVYSRAARSQMQHAVASFRPDLAHLHIYYGQLTASILSPLAAAGIPVVQTLHEYKLVCPTHGLYAHGRFCDACHGSHYWRAIAKRCNRGSVSRSALSALEAYVSNFLGARNRVSRFIAVSDFQRDQLVRLGIPGERISVLALFSAQCDSPPDRPGDYVLYVGRIQREKGIGTLLDGFAALGDNAPPLKIVGAGAELPHWQAYAQSLGLQKRVDWLGFRSGKELSDLYRGCLVVVNPSLLNETFGLTCLEAMSHGRPVIASRVGALPEIVDHERNGILVPAGSADALTESILRMARDPGSANDMGRRGWEKVGREFTKTQHYDALMSIYADVAHN